MDKKKKLILKPNFSNCPTLTATKWDSLATLKLNLNIPNTCLWCHIFSSRNVSSNFLSKMWKLKSKLTSSLLKIKACMYTIYGHWLKEWEIQILLYYIPNIHLAQHLLYSWMFISFAIQIIEWIHQQIHDQTKAEGAIDWTAHYWNNAGMKKGLLTKDENLTFDHTVDMARVQATTINNWVHLQEEQSPQVKDMHQVKKWQPVKYCATHHLLCHCLASVACVKIVGRKYVSKAQNNSNLTMVAA